MKFQRIEMNGIQVLQFHEGGRRSATEDDLYFLGLLEDCANAMEEAGRAIMDLASKAKLSKKEADRFQAIYDRLALMVDDKIRGEG